MPDSISVQPLKQNDPLQTMSGILGIQQQRQALQTGQYTQSSAQANSENDQMSLAERKRVATYLSNPANKGRSTDDMADEITQIAPTTGQEVISGLRKNDQTKTAVQTAVTDLGAKKAGLAANWVRSLAGGQHTPEQVLSQMDGLEAAEPQLKGLLDPLRDRVQHMPPPGPQRDEGVRSLATMLDGKSGTAMGEQDKGTTVQPTFNNGITAPTAAGPAYNKSSIQDVGTGQKAVVGPQGVSVLPGAANTTAAQQIATKGSAAGVTDRVQQAQSAANNTTGAQDALSRAKAILESSESPDTGSGFERKKDLKNLMSSLGIDTQGADDMNTLTKNLARYEASRATQSGLGGTDAARELAHAGSPNTALDNKALLGVVRQSLATEKANAMYAGIQAKHANDPDAMTKNEADYRQIPHLIEAHEYGMMRNKGEADEFLHKHGLDAETMAKSRQAIKEFGSR